jgi:integrase
MGSHGVSRRPRPQRRIAVTTQAAYRNSSQPSAALVIREHGPKIFYEAKFRHQGQQVRRRIGQAWLTRSATGEWVPRRGRVPNGYFDIRKATVAAAEIVERHVSGVEASERAEHELRERGPTFRAVAAAYLQWLEDVKGAKPSTLADHRLLLADPGTPARRGSGVLTGHIMRALGNLPAAKITTRDIEKLLDTIAATGAKPRTVNKHRAVVSAIFVYGAKGSTYGLPANPAREADKRSEPHAGRLEFYRVDEVEAIARAFEAEGRREQSSDINPRLDAEMVRVSAYAGLRLGELLALRWRDIDFAKRVIVVSRAMSDGIETTTKSGRVRQVPLADPAAAALDRISRGEHFTSADDLVCASVLGRHIDGSALRRRYRRAQAAAGVGALRWHDLRHTFGSLLAADGVDLVTIQAAMGHSVLATTSRYLHARPASSAADRFSRAFGGTPAEGVMEGVS